MYHCWAPGKCQVPGVVALTFDDFPNERLDELLDLLKTWNATSTFFCNGPYDPRESVLQEAVLGPRVRKIYNAGHQIASHTQTFMDEMTRFDDWLNELLGVSAPRYMRMPYNECNDTCARDLTLAGYKVVGYGLDTEDWKHRTPQTVHGSVKIVHDYVEALKARLIVDLTADIVLMHGFHNTTITTVAPAVLEAFSSVGFRFVSVAECLGHPRESWYR
ncbi:Polysaccharide deacetylase [Macrophomina phaseolina MS6]|uniref:Polysaccharide deacetylase n=1 Tax=Macrophomina phaseolina (strain MS6) TaxID=1126212 RepID=K2SE03_MACPH|nr:Polysaccharide deacetylase [Macrophomina phaseolina MS6]